MGFDRNTVIGFVLLGLLLFGYLYLSTKGSHELEAQRQHVQDSVARVHRAQEAADSLKRLETAKLDTTVKAAPAVVDSNSFEAAFKGSEQLLTVENELVKVVFSNKGGQPVKVELKRYKAYDSTPVRLAGPGSRISYPINTGSGAADIAQLYFKPGQVMKNPDGSQTIRFRLPTPAGEGIEHEYVLPANDYTLDWNVNINNPERLFSQNNFNLGWHIEAPRAQLNIGEERRLTSIGYYEDSRFDYMNSKTDLTFEKPVQWVAMSRQFFNSTLIAKTGFTGGSVHWQRDAEDSSNVVARGDIALQAKVPATANASMAFKFYYGPNDFAILDREAPGMTHIIDLGRGIYSFVRPLNVYVFMPVFNFFKSNINNFGIAILLLTLFIRLITSPLVYSSYLSGAKMKALRPEIETLKKKTAGDQQQMGMEQMKLFREAGVNPLGGCIPALLQIPIFFALYSFFGSNIGLRGESFLWSHDLSNYDTILHLGFTVPLGFGNHISLFALTAVVTSFLISLYGMSMTPDQSNPAMKYMPYIMPVFLLVFFNRLASALTWYYTVSNLITLTLQFVIQNYIIDHTKILAKLQQNRSKPKTKSKWQERLEQMQEAQKDAQKRGPQGKK